MTGFKAPLFHYTESNPPVSTDPVTAQAVTAAGWNNRGNLRVSGASTLAGGATVSGAIVNGARGDRVVLSQMVTVTESLTAATTIASLYPGNSLLDIYHNPVASFGTAASTVNILYGDTSSDARFGTLTNVSGKHQTLRANGTPALDLASNLTTKRNILVKVTAVSGAVSGAQGRAITNIVYTR